MRPDKFDRDFEEWEQKRNEMQGNARERRKAIDELTRIIKDEKIFCPSEVDYLLTIAIRNRISAITQSGVTTVDDIDGTVIEDCKNQLVPFTHSKNLYKSALRKKGVSEEVIHSLPLQALQELTRVFCDVSCDKPYSVKELLDMI